MRKKNYKPYKQGIFKPIHKEKYDGTYPIYYRSSLELRLMKWIDRNSKITKWGSESVVVPYVHPKDGRVHRYFPDFNFTIQREDGYKKYLVEVKPHSQTKPPNPNKKNKKSLLYEQYQYSVNAEKWKAAEVWCKKHGYEFLIFTEKHLKKK